MKSKLLLTIVAVAAFTVGLRAQTTPQTHDEFVKAGRECAQRGDMNCAASWYTKAINVQPDDFEVILGRAGAYAAVGKLDNSLKDLNVVLAKYPTSLVALHLRGSLYNAKKDYKKAHADAAAILALDANSAKGLQVRGGAYMGQKKYKEAEADLTCAIGIDSRDPINYTYRAVVYEVQGMAAKSQADKLMAEQVKRGQ